jgi:cell division protease FtsH
MTFGSDKVTSGTAGDIEAATKLARMMVTRWGLSKELGTVVYADNQDEVFLGHSVSRQQSISEETAQAIANEVRRLIDAALGQATQILTAQRDQLEALAQGLLLHETLSGEDIRAILDGRQPTRNDVQ